MNPRTEVTSLRFGFTGGVPALLIAAVGLFALAGCDDPATPPAPKPMPVEHLNIVTPHNENVRIAFGEAFAAWHRREYGSDVNVHWIVNGTPQCVQYVTDYVTLPIEAAPRKAPDIMFGGGVVDHVALSERGYSRPVKLEEANKLIPAEVRGLPTRHPDGHWHAAGLTTFGILYNEVDCQGRDIAPPKTWADLADPRFSSWLGIADPAASGSHRQCMMLILQEHGWKEGWGIVLRILANSRALADRSSQALRQVRSGVSLACFAVNSDGMTQVEQSHHTLRYVDPPGTAVTPGLISALNTGHNGEIAEQFVKFVLSDMGQKLWGLRSEAVYSYAPTLYHYPILPTVYTDEANKAALAVPRNPLKDDFGQRVDPVSAQKQATLLAPMVHAACGRENHLLLQRTWAAVIKAGLPADAMAELLTPPLSEEEAYDRAIRYRRANHYDANELMQNWSKQFTDKYNRVLEMVGGA